MKVTSNTIVTQEPPDKALLRERSIEREKIRPTRQEFDALRELWRDGLVIPDDRFFDLIASRDTFPRSRIDGKPGLLPGLRILAFPGIAYGESYVVVSSFDDNLVLSHTGLERCEAWKIGIAAVKVSNADFALVNRVPTTEHRRLFSRRGMKCIVHPDGRGRWAWGTWGGDGVPRGEYGLSKAECLRHAESCVLCGGEITITNAVPLNRKEREDLYAV